MILMNPLQWSQNVGLRKMTSLKLCGKLLMRLTETTLVRDSLLFTVIESPPPLSVSPPNGLSPLERVPDVDANVNMSLIHKQLAVLVLGKCILARINDFCAVEMKCIVVLANYV